MHFGQLLLYFEQRECSVKTATLRGNIELPKLSGHSPYVTMRALLLFFINYLNVRRTLFWQTIFI